MANHQLPVQGGQNGVNPGGVNICHRAQQVSTFGKENGSRGDMNPRRARN